MITLGRSKSGIPTAMESGGGASNTGNAVIVAGKNWEKKTPIHIFTGGHLSNGDHAVIPVVSGDKIIKVNRHKEDLQIKIEEIISIGETIDGETNGETAQIAQFSYGEWDGPVPEEAAEAIDAAVEKSYSYHCRSTYYVDIEEYKKRKKY